MFFTKICNMAHGSMAEICLLNACNFFFCKLICSTKYVELVIGFSKKIVCGIKYKNSK